MKFIKRFLIVIVVLLVLAVVALLAAPILFKDQIVDNVKTAVNKAVTAEVEFEDVNLSFLSSFPDVSLIIDDLEIIGVDTFAGLPLLTAKRAQIDVGFWSVVGDEAYQIDAVALDEPFVNLKVLSADLANYLIVAETEDAAAPPTDNAPAAAQINLNHFEINNGTFIYDDRTTETYLKMEGLNTEGDGNFTDVIFDLDLDATADAVTLKQSGTAYLKKVKTVAEGLVNIDLDQMKFTFLDTKARLNALDLVFAGNIDLEDNEDILFDLNYSAPANDFRQLWSLVPAAYTQGYEDVKTRGSFTLLGTVNGAYNGTTNKYPAFTLKTEVRDGSVQYPGRPEGLTAINANVAVNSPSSDLNRLTVNVPTMNFNLAGDPFRGSFKLATPLTDPQVDATLKGKIDLDKWAAAIPLDGIRELGGQIIADVTLNRVRQSLIDAGRYQDMNVLGDVRMTDFVYAADGLPVVRVPAAEADFTPQAINVPAFTATLGRSDVAGSGQINNPLAYFSPEQTMKGNFTLRSDFFDADEWMEETPETSNLSPAELDQTTAAATETTEVFDRFDFDVDAEIKALQYAEYRPTNLSAKGNVKPNKLSLNASTATLANSSFAATGIITNLLDYTLADGVLGGQLDVTSDYIDLMDFMTEEATEAAASATPATTEAEAAIPVPTNINLAVNMVANRVKYDNIDLDNLAGQLLVQNGQAVIQDGKANLLGGAMNFAGAYDTSEPGDPGFRFKYNLDKLDFSQSFEKLNSFALLAPIGKYLRGRFSTDMVIDGKLGADLFPKLSTINAEGLLKTLDASISGTTPISKIGKALNIEELKNSTTLRNIITFFHIQEGKVKVEPFDFRIAGIPMMISGTHGLEMDMDYAIRAAVPRDKIKGNIVTGTALSALDQLAGKAGKLGLNISPGDTLNVVINLLGSFADPTMKFDLLGSKDGTGSVQDAVVDAVTDRVNTEIETRKEEAETEINTQVTNTRDLARARADSLRRLGEARAQLVKDSISRAAAAQADRLKEQAARELRNRLRLDSLRADSLLRNVPGADQVRDAIDRFNPFKKKKKDGGR